MNKIAAADPNRERRTKWIHMAWPASVKRRVQDTAKGSGLSVTETVIRILERAHETGVVADWLRDGPIRSSRDAA